MTGERRQQEGFAIITRRAGTIAAHSAAAGLRARVLAVQDGPAWPEIRPPAVLDTVGLPVEELIALLADPPRMRRPNGHESRVVRALRMPLDQGTGPAHSAALVPLVALVDADDWRTLRLLPLCPAVYLISGVDTPSLGLWARYLTDLIPPHDPHASPLWLVPTPPLLTHHVAAHPARSQNALDPLLLPILAALGSSVSYTSVALHCDVSESTLSRVLRMTRSVLGLPSGDVSRFPPSELAALILERLGADAPLAAQQVRNGPRARCC